MDRYSQYKKYFVSQDVPKQLKNTSMIYKSFFESKTEWKHLFLIYLKIYSIDC